MGMKEAIILAGGKGERLGMGFGEQKCMQKVARRPIVEWVLRQAVSKGVEHVVMAIGRGGQEVRQHFGTGYGFGCRIHYCDTLEGTGVAFLKAQELLEGEGPFLVLNGDTYVEYDLDKVANWDGIGVFWCSVVMAGVWVFPMLIRWQGELPKSLEEVVGKFRNQEVSVEKGVFWDIGTPEKLRRAREELHLVLPMRFAEWEVKDLQRWLGRVGKDMAHHAAVVGREIAMVLGSGGKVMVVGNGGSNADAMHFGTELQNGLVKGDGKGGNRVMVLGSESPYLTARVNDYEDGTHTIFAKLVEAWADKGDVLLCLSTSGYSENVVRAAIKGKEMGCLVGGFCREDSNLAALMVMGFAFPEEMGTQRIQEMTMVALHCIAAEVEAGQ